MGSQTVILSAVELSGEYAVNNSQKNGCDFSATRTRSLMRMSR